MMETGGIVVVMLSMARPRRTWRKKDDLGDGVAGKGRPESNSKVPESSEGGSWCLEHSHGLGASENKYSFAQSQGDPTTRPPPLPLAPSPITASTTHTNSKTTTRIQNPENQKPENVKTENRKAERIDFQIPVFPVTSIHSPAPSIFNRLCQSTTVGRPPYCVVVKLPRNQRQREP